jgi:predicted P-loop ATPase
MLDYIKEVLCSSNQDHYIYLLKWIANMVHGNKNDSILYLRSKQGYGKSTLFEFLSSFVVGDDLSLMTGSEPLLSKNNAILAGKLLVYFEELETFTTAQWMGVSSRLKKQATSKKMVYENKYEKPYEARNMNNYAILSNNDAIKDDEGRRYFILDISGHRQIIKGSKTEAENQKFWDNVYSCFSDEVGHAFYCYIMEEVDTKGFKPQNFPMTDNKIDSFAKRLEAHENFIKHNYVLQKLGIKCTVQELYDEYVDFCKKEQRTPSKKIEFGAKLKELGIEYYKTNELRLTAFLCLLLLYIYIYIYI